jgi:hypothetical protein
LGSKFAKLKVLQLFVAHEECRDDERQPTNLIRGNEADDSYIRIARHLATLPQLRVLHLRGPLVISANFFRHISVFPTLVEFELDFSAATADGRWFFEKDEELVKSLVDSDDEEEEEEEHQYFEDSDEEEWETRPIVDLSVSGDEDGPLVQRDDRTNHFRTKPNETIITDLMVDVANFLEASSTMQKFILRHRHSAEESNTITWKPWKLEQYGRTRNFQFWYLRSGAHRNHNDKFNQCRIPADEPFVMRDRIYWRVGERWRPNAKIVDALGRTLGKDVKFCFLSNDFWDERHWWGSQYNGDVEWEEPGKPTCR